MNKYLVVIILAFINLNIHLNIHFPISEYSILIRYCHMAYCAPIFKIDFLISVNSL